MKSKKINYDSLEDLDTARLLMEVLEQLRIGTAAQELTYLDETICEDFCSTCEQHYDHCECLSDGYHNSYYDSDDAYDRWKDEQAERELEKDKDGNN